MKPVCAYCGSSFRVSRFKGGEPLCLKHYLQMYRFGEISDKPRSRNTNIVTIEREYAVVRTARSEKILIDIEDLPIVSPHSWCLSKTGYAVARINGKTVKMHRMLTQCPATKVVDHVNGDRLDNRRRNLRICSPKENSRNKGMGRNNQSGFPGVSKTSNGKWRVRIMVNRKEIALGRYAAMEEAIQVRREAEEKYFGDMSSAKSRSGQ